MPLAVKSQSPAETPGNSLLHFFTAFYPLHIFSTMPFIYLNASNVVSLRSSPKYWCIWSPEGLFLLQTVWAASGSQHPLFSGLCNYEPIIFCGGSWQKSSETEDKGLFFLREFTFASSNAWLQPWTHLSSHLKSPAGGLFCVCVCVCIFCLLEGYFCFFKQYLKKVFIYLYTGFPGGSDDKESACNVGNPGSIPGSGRSPGEGDGNLLQYSGLETSMDTGAWQTRAHGVRKSQTQLNE